MELDDAVHTAILTLKEGYVTVKLLGTNICVAHVGMSWLLIKWRG